MWLKLYHNYSIRYIFWAYVKLSQINIIQGNKKYVKSYSILLTKVIIYILNIPV